MRVCKTAKTEPLKANERPSLRYPGYTVYPGQGVKSWPVTVTPSQSRDHAAKDQLGLLPPGDSEAKCSTTTIQ
eukprot:2489381-Rhodomonas_salina.1